MTIIDQKELDRQMRRVIDPNSVPRHNGGDQGCMEGRIRGGSDESLQESGYGRRGGSEVDPRSLGDERFYGSASVISLKDLPPDPAEHAKKSKPRSPQELLAMLGLKPKD